MRIGQTNSERYSAPSRQIRWSHESAYQRGDDYAKRLPPDAIPTSQLKVQPSRRGSFGPRRLKTKRSLPNTQAPPFAGPDDSGAADDMQTAPSCGIVGGPAAGAMANFHPSAVWPTAACNVTRFTRLPRVRVVISSETWRTVCHRQISVGEACLAQIRIQS